MSVTRPINRRAGFTLVELLVVISIIAVLSALLTVGLYAAYNSTRSYGLSNEIIQVDTSLEQFKSKYGTYPSDMQSATAFTAFINKAYPRADRTAIVTFQNALTANSKVIDPAEALVLYLAFTSKDPRYPFRFAFVMASDPPIPLPVNPNAPASWKGSGGGLPTDLEILYEFPAGSLRDADGDGFPEFTQKNAKGAPLAYFDARTYTQIVPASSPPMQVARNVQFGFQNAGYLDSAGNPNRVVPYASGIDPTYNNNFIFFNPKSYQLVSAGLDGDFGVAVSASANYPILNASAPLALPRISETDGDNIANFTSQRKFDSFLAQ